MYSKHMAPLPEPQQGTAARRLELHGLKFRFEKLSISRIYDYIWVEIAYGLEKIVLMPRTWSVRIFAKKTACLVA